MLNTAMMVCYDDGMHSVHYKHGTTSSGTLGQEAGTQIMSLIIFEFFLIQILSVLSRYLKGILFLYQESRLFFV